MQTQDFRQDVPDTSCDDAAVEAAFRRLSWSDQWRVARDAGWGRTRGRPQEAAMLAWWARRDLHRYPWIAGVLGVYFLGVIVLWPRSSFGLWVSYGPFIGGLVGCVIGLALRASMMKRGIAANQKVMRAAGLPVPVGRPHRVIDGRFVLRAVGTLALLGALLWWFPKPATSAQPLPLPPALDSPAEVPNRLADGRPVAEVPPEVAAVWPGRDIVAGIEAPELLDEDSGSCDVGTRWSEDPVVGPVMLGPAGLQVAVEGEVRSASAPQRVILCEYTADGELRHRDERNVFAYGGDLGGGGSGGEEGITTMRDVIVPDGSVWALVDQGRWVLGMPVEGAPALRVRITTRTSDTQVSPTVGEIRFATAQGELVTDE